MSADGRERGGRSPERFESSVLLGVDIEQVVDPGHLKQGLHPRVDVDKFHFSARLPDAAKAAGQFAQAIAVNEIHALEIDQELLMAIAGKDMNKVAQLSATVSQRESSHNVNHNDAIALSRCDLKTHIRFAGWLFSPESYAWLSLASRLGCIFRGWPIQARFWLEWGFPHSLNVHSSQTCVATCE
jgi:hypothetical protein